MLIFGEAPPAALYCQGACDHIGAAFSVILEEKTALGLVKPPVERVPAESLTETELVARALEERTERAIPQLTGQY